MSREPEVRGVTRRGVLRSAAVAGAVALIDPAGAVASASSLVGSSVALAGARGVFSRSVGSLAGGESGVIAAPARFALVGVQWRGARRARIELRARALGGGWSPWVSATVVGHDSDGVSDGPERFGEPIWTGPADEVQLRSAGVVHGVRLHFVAAPPMAGLSARSRARVAQALPLAQPILDAGPGQPPIIARSAWARGQAPPSHVPEYGTVKLAFVHHSETPNGYGPADVPSILMSIFDYHRYVRGFWDIAYNFAVDAFGRVWEARAGGIDQAVIGAHAGGYNAESTGVVVLGTFMSVLPAPAAIQALQHVLAWKLSLHGVPVLGHVGVQVAASGASYSPYPPGAHVSLPRVAGHRDGDQTSCPGDALYGRLPAIRPRVAQLAGTPLRLTIAAPVPPVSPGTTVAVTGRLSSLSGLPLAGAPVEVQQIGTRGAETTVATETTDTNGAWTFTVVVAQNTLLRALHRPAPAAVSDVVVISVAPILTLTLDSVAPLRVSGTVAPPAGPVIVDAYKLGPGRQRRLVASKRVPVNSGAFSAPLRARGPGRYAVIARTEAGARYAAGASAPLQVTIA